MPGRGSRGRYRRRSVGGGKPKPFGNRSRLGKGTLRAMYAGGKRLGIWQHRGSHARAIASNRGAWWAKPRKRGWLW